jgi:O-antigen/teichoic acid export membrane protein
MYFLKNKNYDLLRYAVPAAFLISKISRLIAIFYLMSLLAPQYFSDWITISLILQYSLYLQLGIPISSSRELSISIGRKDTNAKIAFSVMPIQFLFFASLLLFIILQNFYHEENFYIIFSYITISHLSALLLTLARSKFQNNKVVIANMIDAVIVVLGIMFWSLSDPIQSILLTYIVAGFFVSLICLPSWEIIKEVLMLNSIKIKKFLYLIKLSLPLVIFNILLLFRGSWDILLLKFFYTLDGEAGYISSQLFIDSIRILSSLLAIFYIPYLAKTFGENKERISYHLIQELKNFKKLTMIIFILGLTTLYPILMFASNYYVEYSNLVNIYYFRTIAILLGIISLPNLLFFNTIRKPFLSIKILAVSIILPMPFLCIFNNFLSLDTILLLMLFISSFLSYFLSEYSFKKVQNN